MSALAAGSARCPLDTDHSRPVSIARIRDKSNASAKCAAHWTTMMQCRPVGQHRGEFLSASRGFKLRRPHDPLTADTHSNCAYPCRNVYYPGGMCSGGTQLTQMDAQHDSAAAPLPNAARAHRAPLTLAPSSISADRCLRVQNADACDATARTRGTQASTARTVRARPSRPISTLSSCVPPTVTHKT